MGYICETCGNANFIEGVTRCSITKKVIGGYVARCQAWEPIEIEGIINAEILAREVADIIYSQGKAKVFNVLESQIEGNERLRASKRITADILDGVCKSAGKLIADLLGDREMEIIPPVQIKRKPSVVNPRDTKIE